MRQVQEFTALMAFTQQDWEEMKELPGYAETMRYIKEEFPNGLSPWHFTYTAITDLARSGDERFVQWLKYAIKIGEKKAQNHALVAAAAAGQTVLVGWIIEQEVVSLRELCNGLLQECIDTAEEKNQANVLDLLNKIKKALIDLGVEIVD